MRILTFGLALVACVFTTTAGAHDIRPASYDGDGIAYTKQVTVSTNHYDDDYERRYRARTGPFVAHVNLDVRGVAAWHDIAAGSYDAQLFCPSPVSRHADETWRRIGVNVGAGTRFALSVPADTSPDANGVTWQCWLRVVVRRANEKAPVRDLLLGVEVVDGVRYDDDRYDDDRYDDYDDRYDDYDDRYDDDDD